MELTMRRVGTSLVVALDGEFDLHTAGDFRAEVDAVLNEDDPPQHLILDLKEVSFVDSSGIGAILGRYKALAGRGGKMVVVGLTTHVRRVFELSGMFKLMQEAQSEKDALKAVGGSH